MRWGFLVFPCVNKFVQISIPVALSNNNMDFIEDIFTILICYCRNKNAEAFT